MFPAFGTDISHIPPTNIPVLAECERDRDVSVLPCWLSLLLILAGVLMLALPYYSLNLDTVRDTDHIEVAKTPDIFRPHFPLPQFILPSLLFVCQAPVTVVFS